MRQNTKWKWWQIFRSKDYNNSEVKVSFGCSVQIFIQSIYLRQDYELIRNDGNMLSCQGEGVPMKMLRATLQVNIWSVTFMQQASALLWLLLNTSVDDAENLAKTCMHQLSQDIEATIQDKL